METICASCGVVIAWTRFDMSESASNILCFLKSVYPTQESYLYDKACQVFRTAVNNGSWDAIWKHTTRFVIDTCHYITHCVPDFLCRIYCNPSPGDGLAPILVVIDYDDKGHPHARQAFNTQVCEQLNAWLGGFESIVKCMKAGNFIWFLHTMLFYHTKH